MERALEHPPKKYKTTEYFFHFVQEKKETKENSRNYGGY